MNTTSTIMVVDDEPAIRKLLKRILEEEGYRVVAASDGTAALNMLEECKPDLMILDYLMPVLNGFDVLNRMREYSNVPVLMLTARKEPDISDTAFNLGADDYVTKPFSTNELLARIRARLRRSPKKPSSECS